MSKLSLEDSLWTCFSKSRTLVKFQFFELEVFLTKKMAMSDWLSTCLQDWQHSILCRMDSGQRWPQHEKDLATLRRLGLTETRSYPSISET